MTQRSYSQKGVGFQYVDLAESQWIRSGREQESGYWLSICNHRESPLGRTSDGRRVAQFDQGYLPRIFSRYRRSRPNTVFSRLFPYIGSMRAVGDVSGCAEKALRGAGGFCGGFGWGWGVLVGVPVHEREGALADAVGGEDAEQHGGD